MALSWGIRMTRVAIVQSNFLPWRGYFDMIDDVDVFVVLDDVQYTRRDWRNRNQIKTRDGLKWITVPVLDEYQSSLIRDVRIASDGRWREKQLGLIEHSYRKAAHFAGQFEEFRALLSADHLHLNDLNIALMQWAAKKLAITTRIVRSSELPSSGTKTARLIELLKGVNATSYLSGPSAEAYIEVPLFAAERISLAYKAYDYGPYAQLWGSFEGAVSVLDLLFNTGAEARSHLKSRAPHRVVHEAAR